MIIDKNIPRKEKITKDSIQFISKDGEDFPLMSVVEISNSGMCNRKCSFCPRSDPDYPDINEFISDELHNKIVDWARVARKNGLLGLEKVAMTEAASYSKKGLQLLVDGNEPEQIRTVMELELYARERRNIEAAKVYEAMGGYAPTIGIIGAVMGLIHVMGNLADPSMLGGGIAVAFVATIYGVGIANLFFIPTANKLQAYARHESHVREMLIEGLMAIADGDNPRNISEKLQGFYRDAD